MMDAKQKVALGLSVALPIGSVALFLGAERDLRADGICPGGCYNGSHNECVPTESYMTLNSRYYYCLNLGGTAQWYPS